MEKSYTKALLGEDKWLTVVVERKVKQAVSETGANARRQRTFRGCRMSQATVCTPRIRRKKKKLKNDRFIKDQLPLNPDLALRSIS